MRTPESNKAVIRNLMRAADEGDLEAVRRCYSPAYVDHDPSVARQGTASDLDNTMAAFAAMLDAFPDTRHTLHDLVAEDDRVVLRISAEATHTGDLFGIAATGLRLRNDSIVIYRLADGVIVERWCREKRSTLDQLRDAARGTGEEPGR